MKHDFINEFQSLLEKFKRKSLSYEEWNRLNAILQKNDDKLIDKLALKWWSEELKADLKPDAELYGVIKERVERAEDIQNYRRSKYHHLQRWVRYAAIALISSCLTWFGVEIGNRNTSSKLTQTEIEYHAPNGSKARVILQDSTLVWLNSGSTLRYPAFFEGSVRKVELTGEAYFDVKNDSKIPFIVKTPDISVQVYGTAFNIKAYPEEENIETTLVEGTISLEAAGNGSGELNKIVLKPNQTAFYSKDEKTFEVYGKEAIAENNIAWLNNKLVFRSVSIDELARKLERWYGITITLVNQDLSDIRFTGTLENETIEQALEALVLTYPFRYTLNKNHVTIRTLPMKK